MELDGSHLVRQFEKIEFKIQSSSVVTNPFNSEEIEVSVKLLTPLGQRLTLPAFFHQPCEYRELDQGGKKVEWIYPTGPAGWRARFTPTEPGSYTVQASRKDRRRTATSQLLAFTCLAQPGHGFLRVSERDRRFLEFQDGQPFFTIGQNLAFIGESQYFNTPRAEVAFRKMSENGANFARVWTCAEDWGLAIEARKSAWARSWGERATLVPLPGGETSTPQCVLVNSNRASVAITPSHPVAWRPNTRYRLTGRVLTDPTATFQLELSQRLLGDAVHSTTEGQWVTFTNELSTGADQWWLPALAGRRGGTGRVWLAQLSLREASGGPELLWEADPNRPVRGVYNQIDCVMLDHLVQAAERQNVYLQICLLTRDLYMSALSDPGSPAYAEAIAAAKKCFRYAIARWGYSTRVAAWEYWNEMDPGRPTERFYREVGDYLDKNDPYHHPRTTSAWGPAPKDWAHPQLDLAELHWYLRSVWGPLWQDEVGAVLDRAKLLRGVATNKPALLAEFGVADDKWGRSPYMPQDKAGVHFHNTLWASSFAGFSGTAMFWWWETLDQNNYYPHYRPLAAFLSDIPWTTAGLQATTGSSTRQAQLLAWRGRDRVYGWLHNPQATWWKLVAEKQTVAEINDDRLTLDQLEPGNYAVEWWDTTSAKITLKETVASEGPIVRLRVPAYTGDIACKVVRTDGGQKP